VFKIVGASLNVGFHMYNLSTYSYDRYKLFWGNGGAHWTSEYKKFVQEEEDHLTTAMNRKDRRTMKSYVAVVKGSRFLTGENRTPIGNQHHKGLSHSFSYPRAM
jgi:hypothetical protein